MKHIVCFVLTAVLVFGLIACGQTAPAVTTAPGTAAATETATEPAPTETEPVETEPAPTETEPVETEPAPTEPEHSELFLPEVSQKDMIAYFNEAVLDTEYSTGDGDPSLVQKWVDPIYYRVTGNPTEEDLVILEALFGQLNEIEGFPGFFPADETRPTEDLTISFLDENTFNIAFSDFLRGEIADGAVQYWYYTDSNIIHSARIGYRTDIGQDIRNSVLLEEVVNGLGFNDTALRSDSIVYQYGSDATALSDVDWLLLKLLYHPDIQCGMNADQCREILEKLYY